MALPGPGVGCDAFMCVSSRWLRRLRGDATSLGTGTEPDESSDPGTGAGCDHYGRRVGISARTTWRQAVDRATYVSALFLFTVQLGLVVVALTEARGQGWADAAPVAVLAVAQVVLGATAAHALLTVGRSRPSAPTAYVAALVGLLAIASDDLGVFAPDFARSLLAVNALQALQLVAVAFVARPTRAALAIATSVVGFVVVRVTRTSVGLLDSIDEILLPTLASLALLVVLDRLRSGAEEADLLEEAARRAARERSLRSNAELAIDEARRVVHDDVISALRSIEVGVAPDDVRRSSRWALRSLREDDRVASVSDLVAHLRETGVGIDVHEGRWDESPPPRVMAALRGAAAEALRNAARHGGVTRAEVALSSVAGRTVLEVRDAGTGLAADWAPGFGVDESLVARMHDVGGTADLATNDAGGVTATLTWPAVQATTATTTGGPLGLRRGRLFGAIAALACAELVWVAARHPGPWPWLGLAVAMGAALLAVVIARLVTSGPPPTSTLVVLGAATVGLTWLGLVAAGDGSLLSIRSWIVGACANAVALLAFETRARAVAAIVGLQVLAVLLYAAQDPTVSITEPAGAYATPIVLGGAGALIGRGLRRGERRVRDARSAVARETETEAWAAARETSRREHLDYLEAEVVPFLEVAAATGEADPRPAGLLAAQCRDDLYLARPLDPATRSAVTAARARGVRVQLRVPDRHAFADPTWRVLRDVLEVVDDGHAVTVVPDADGDRVVAVPALVDARVDRVGAAVTSDPARSVFRVAP